MRWADSGNALGGQSGVCRFYIKVVVAKYVLPLLHFSCLLGADYVVGCVASALMVGQYKIART